MIDFKGQNKIAEKWLLEYPERKQQYIERMHEFGVLGSTVYTGLPTGTDVGMPTQAKAITLVHLDEERLWIMTIEDTESTLSEKKRAFLDARRWVDEQQQEFDPGAEGGRPGWIDRTVIRYAKWHERRYGRYYEPSRRAIMYWWNEIINVAVRIAIKRGCL